MFDLINEISQTLRNNKLRTALTGFAVAWGIFMLIILLSLSRGMLNNFISFASSSQNDRISVYPGYTTKPWKGYKDNRPISFKEDDVNSVLHHNNTYVRGVAPQNSIDTAKVSTDTEYISHGLQGVYPVFIDQDRAKVVKGRFINDIDIKQRRKVMVLHSRSAKLLFGSEEAAIGRHVKSMGLSWLVVGVYDREWGETPMAPFSTVDMLRGFDHNVNQFDVALRNVTDMTTADQSSEDVRHTLSSTLDFAPDDNSAVWLSNRFSDYLSALNGISIMNIAVWLIGIFTMLSGIVGVSNIMFVSVRERTHEIGIRRAIGAKPRSILLQVVAESIAITTLFGYIGLLFGVVVMRFVAEKFGDSDFMKDPTIDLSIAFQVMAVLIVAGALAGLFPAIKATKVRPVEALRDE